MKKHLLKILLTTFLISLFITTILIGFMIQTPSEESPNSSCDMSGIAYGIGWGIILFMTIGNITIFLNLHHKIRAKYFYSILSFLLLPLVNAFISILTFGDFSSGYKFYMAIILPYLLIILFHFFRYQNKLEKIVIQ